MTEDEMVGWHHQLDGHESEQAPGVDKGQGSLACCSPWGGKELETTKQLNNKTFKKEYLLYKLSYWFHTWLLHISELDCEES